MSTKAKNHVSVYLFSSVQCPACVMLLKMRAEGKGGELVVDKLKRLCREKGLYFEHVVHQDGEWSNQQAVDQHKVLGVVPELTVVYCNQTKSFSGATDIANFVNKMLQNFSHHCPQ